MFKKIKFAGILPVLLFVIAALFIVFNVVLISTLNNERIEKGKLQDELAKVMKERNRLSEEIEELKLIKSDLEIKTSQLETESKILSESYEKERSQGEFIRAELDKKSRELVSVQARLKSITDEKQKLEGMLEQDKSRYDQLKERVEKLVEVKNVLEEKVRDIIDKQGVNLERIVVKAEGELEGKVLVVNREYNFIVVDIGVRDEVAVGDTLMVFRGGKYLGEAHIEKIYDTMSAATIVKEAKANSIKVGDDVVLRSE